MQIIRNEDLKADMRSASDRALMMILTAVMGHKDPDAQETAKLGPDGKPLTAEQQAAADQRAFRKLLGQPEDSQDYDMYGTEEGKAGSAGTGTGTGVSNGLGGPLAMTKGVQMLRRFAQGNNIMSAHGTVLAKAGFSLKAVPEEAEDEMFDAALGSVDAEGNLIDMDEIDDEFGSVDDNDDSSITSLDNTLGSVGSDSYSTNGGKRAGKSRKTRRSKYTRNIRASGTGSGTTAESKTKDGDAAHGDNELSASINRLESGVDLDIKVTLSKGVHYQVGSQGYPLALSPAARAKSRSMTGLALDTTLTEDQSKFLQEESYLSGLVTRVRA